MAGSCDFLPLTYGAVSPFRHAQCFLVTGLSREYAKRFFCALRHRQRGESWDIRRVANHDLEKEITGEAFEYLYEVTGGQLHLLRQIVLTSASLDYQTLDVAPPSCVWTKRVVENCIEQFVELHMPEDLQCRMTVREVEREADTFDLLLGVLRRDATTQIEGVQPHMLEVSGLVRRARSGKGSISCEVWRRFLEGYLTDRHVADVYARQHRWPDAWAAYERLPKQEHHRPISGDAAFRLRSVLFDWEDSLLDYVDQGPLSPCGSSSAGGPEIC